jgi:CRISPR-associated protein Cmr3
LTPTERFFFGGDRTFGPDNEHYFVRSRYFPQQTTLLGFMRYVVLKEKGLMDEMGKVTVEKGVEEDKIGKSFNHTENRPRPFGIIKALSPVFISGPDGDYFVQSREYCRNTIEDPVSGIVRKQLVPLIFKKVKTVSSSDNIPQFIPRLEGITSKSYFPELLVNIQIRQMRNFLFQRDHQEDPMNGIFIADDQVGIRKNDKRDDQEGIRNNDEPNDRGFFRQVGYQMVQGYCFAFYAELEDDAFTVANSFYKMGADQSWFRVSVKEESDLQIEDFCGKVKACFIRPTPLDRKIVLLSDTFLLKEIYEDIFASSDTISFNYMQTKAGSENKFKNVRAGISKSKVDAKFELLRRGSVLYLNDPARKTEITDIITGVKESKGQIQYQAFHAIGYNHVI